MRRELADSQKMVFRVKSQKRQRLGQLEGEAGQLSDRCAQLQQLNEQLEAQLAGRADTAALEAERDRLQQGEPDHTRGGSLSGDRMHED